MPFIRILSVSSTGIGLITSVSLLSFVDTNTLVVVDINSYEAEELNSKINPVSVSRDYESKEFEPNSQGFYVNSNRWQKRYFLHKFYWDLNNFSLFFKANEKDYLSVSKDDVNIKLFTTSAWNSSSYEDEYGTEVNVEQVKSLFEGLNEIKVKQLLLSLTIKRSWEKWYNETNFAAKGDIFRPSSVNHLKDLKIKYFRDFDSLKNYVQIKVGSCINDKKSCVAREGELGIIDQDKLSFFEKPKS